MTDRRQDTGGSSKGETVLKVTLLITSSAIVSLIVSLLTGTMNVGGYIKQINLNTQQLQQNAAQIQVLMLAEAQEKTLIDSIVKSVEKLSNDRDVNFGTIKAIAERLATLETQVRAESKAIDDLQADYNQHRKTEEEVLRALNNK